MPMDLPVVMDERARPSTAQLPRRQGQDVDRNTIDARSARIAIAMYLRWWFVPLAALLAGFIIGGALTQETAAETESSATMVIGLTEEVRWPFFDAVLARQEGLITENDLPATASTNTGIEHLAVEISSTNVQNSTLVVTATVAGSGEDAATFADELGRLLVEKNLDDRRANLLLSAEGLEGEIAQIQIEAAELDAELTALNDQWVSIQDQIIVADPEDVPTLQGQATEVDNDRRIMQRRIDGLIGLETSLTTQLTQARINANQTGNPIEVSAEAVAGATDTTDLRPIMAVLFFLLSLIAIPFLERRFGRVRSVDHLATIWPGARVVDARNRRLDKATINPIDVARLAARAEGESDTVAVAALANTSVAGMVVSALEADDAITSLVDLSSARDMERVVSADKLAIVVPAGKVGLRRAERVADNLNTLSADPMVVLLASKKDSKTTTSYVDHLAGVEDDDELLDIDVDEDEGADVVELHKSDDEGDDDMHASDADADADEADTGADDDESTDDESDEDLDADDELDSELDDEDLDDDEEEEEDEAA